MTKVAVRKAEVNLVLVDVSGECPCHILIDSALGNSVGEGSEFFWVGAESKCWGCDSELMPEGGRFLSVPAVKGHDAIDRNDQIVGDDSAQRCCNHLGGVTQGYRCVVKMRENIDQHGSNS